MYHIYVYIYIGIYPMMGKSYVCIYIYVRHIPSNIKISICIIYMSNIYIFPSKCPSDFPPKERKFVVSAPLRRCAMLGSKPHSARRRWWPVLIYIEYMYVLYTYIYIHYMYDLYIHMVYMMYDISSTIKYDILHTILDILYITHYHIDGIYIYIHMQSERER